MSRKHNKRGNKNKGKNEKRNARASKVATDGALPDIQDDEDTLEDEESTTSSEKPKRGRTSKRHKDCLLYTSPSPRDA